MQFQSVIIWLWFIKFIEELIDAILRLNKIQIIFMSFLCNLLYNIIESSVNFRAEIAQFVSKFRSGPDRIFHMWPQEGTWCGPG